MEKIKYLVIPEQWLSDKMNSITQKDLDTSEPKLWEYRTLDAVLRESVIVYEDEILPNNPISCE